MHVHASTGISADEVKARFNATGASGPEGTTPARRLVCETRRSPPKFFLNGVAVTLPAAAEVAINERPEGAEVVLRLMWGPLPAPFPRVLAAVGVLLGVLIGFFSNGSFGGWMAAVLVALLPFIALLYQQSGERNLQSQLGELLGGVSFLPKPH